MASRYGKIKFWWGDVFVRYGEPTRKDKIGCDGMYYEGVHVKSKLHLLIFYILSKFNAK